ncbi:MAG: DUF456 domain-containing protein [Myxococcota bacterium]|nr:DUF456 domain-containing protein [Myxococcota bacterium]
METLLFIAVGVVLAVGGLACVVAVLLGLPGTWILLGFAVLVELMDGYWTSAEAPVTFGIPVLVGCLLAAGLGEALELVSGALGAKHAGSSRRGIIGAFFGGLAGLVLGTAIPVPVAGSLFGALLGCFVGALAGEMSHENAKMEGALKPAIGAVLGKVVGTLAKLPVVLGVWGVLLFIYITGGLS